MTRNQVNKFLKTKFGSEKIIKCDDPFVTSKIQLICDALAAEGGTVRWVSTKWAVVRFNENTTKRFTLNLQSHAVTSDSIRAYFF